MPGRSRSITVGHGRSRLVTVDHGWSRSVPTGAPRRRKIIAVAAEGLGAPGGAAAGRGPWHWQPLAGSEAAVICSESCLRVSLSRSDECGAVLPWIRASECRLPVSLSVSVSACRTRLTLASGPRMCYKTLASPLCGHPRPLLHRLRRLRCLWPKGNVWLLPSLLLSTPADQ